MSSGEREEKEAIFDQQGDEDETPDETEPDERQAVHDEEIESDSDIENESASSTENDGVNIDKLRALGGLLATSSAESSASGHIRKNIRNTKKKASSKGSDDDNDGCDDSDVHTDEEPDLLQSTDSDSDDEQTSYEPKTLDKLGITLNKSKLQWKSQKILRAQELGTSTPYLFTRNVAGSLNMVQKLKLEKKLEYHAGCVNTLNFNESGDLLASGSDDLSIVLWDWSKGRKRFHYESGHTGNVFQAKFMPNTSDSIVVSCARDGQVRAGYLSSLGSCNRTKRLAQHKDGAHKLSIEPGSPNTFLTCGEDGQVIQLDLRLSDGWRQLTCRGEKGNKIPLYSIFINPANHKEFAVGGRDHRCRIYDQRHMKEDHRAKIQAVKEYCPSHFENKDSYTNITCLVYSHDGSELLVSYNDEDIYLFDANSSSNAEHIHRYKGHRNNITVKGVNFYGPRSEFIVSGSDCGHVFLWDKETESIVQLLKGDDAGVVNCLEPHPYFPFLATSGLDHDVKIWSPTSNEPVDFENIKTVVLSNDRERDEERRRPQYPFNGDLLMFMVNHIARRHLHATESDTEDGNDEDSNSDNDERMQCVPS